MSGFLGEDESRRRPKKKARGSPAGPHPHQESLAHDPSSFVGAYQQGWPNGGFCLMASQQTPPQMQAVPSYGTDETLGGSSAGRTAHAGPLTSPRQIFPDQAMSDSPYCPPLHDFGFPQQQISPWYTSALGRAGSIINDWSPPVPPLHQGLTGFGIANTSVTTNSQLQETDFDFDGSYFGPGQTTAIQSALPHSDNPYTASTFELDSGLNWEMDVESVGADPSSGSSMSLTPYEWIHAHPEGCSSVQEEGLMSMQLEDEPWSVENTRAVDSSLANVPLTGPRYVNPSMPTEDPQDHTSSSAYTQSTDLGSSMFNNDMALSATTVDDFNTEIDEMISSLPTVRAVSTGQQGIDDPTPFRDDRDPTRHHPKQGRQVPEIRFWFRPDTPSRGLEAPPPHDTVV